MCRAQRILSALFTLRDVNHGHAPGGEHAQNARESGWRANGPRTVRSRRMRSGPSAAATSECPVFAGELSSFIRCILRLPSELLYNIFPANSGFITYNVII